ncbi:P2Y purinoceptor 11 isoform X1 [Gadus morhua]|uniref:P2Y purinoceptor 11 isoform X1 n=2 Tax=Gadus morhua TaxID=8049 RepID=UPI0011B55DB0|nr:P2Y purinoceptor 11 isoform X1 [Gadus morhua]
MYQESPDQRRGQLIMSVPEAPLANATYSRNPCVKFQLALLPSVYAIELCVALAGNLFAIWLLLSRERKNWHTGVVLSCNLAVSDLLYVLTLPLLIDYYRLDKHWNFGNVFCKIERFMFACNLYVSIFFIMGISVNRCVALAYPFFTRSQVTPSRAKVASAIIWLVVASFSSPVLKFASTCPAGGSNNTIECVAYCGSDHGDQRSHFYYVVWLGVLGCFVPFLVTFASYCVVIWVVWKNTNISRLDKQKIALMVISVVVLYALSFVPYHVFQSYNLYLKIFYPGRIYCWVYDAYQVSKVLAALNMCLHPLLYMAVFDSIRVVFCGKNQDE